MQLKVEPCVNLPDLIRVNTAKSLGKELASLTLKLFPPKTSHTSDNLVFQTDSFFWTNVWVESSNLPINKNCPSAFDLEVLALSFDNALTVKTTFKHVTLLILTF